MATEQAVDNRPSISPQTEKCETKVHEVATVITMGCGQTSISCSGMKWQSLELCRVSQIERTARWTALTDIEGTTLMISLIPPASLTAALYARLTERRLAALRIRFAQLQFAAPVARRNERIDRTELRGATHR